VSDESVSTASTMDTNTQPESTAIDDEQSETSCTVMSIGAAVPCEAASEFLENPLDVCTSSLSDGSNATPTSYQLEFLKMLSSQMPAETSDEWWPTQKKVPKKSLVEHKSKKKSSEKRWKSTAAGLQDFRSTASSTVTSERSVTQTQEANDHRSSLQHVISGAKQTSSLTDCSAAVSSTESLDSTLVSLFTDESGQILEADVLLAPEINDCSFCDMQESGSNDMPDIFPSSDFTSRESFKCDDDQVKCHSTVWADVLPPDLSLPDPEMDININPPVLEPYDGECLSVTGQTVSCATSVAVPCTGSTHGQRSLVKTSDRSGDELKALDCAGTELPDETSLSDVVDITQSPDSVSVTVCSFGRDSVSVAYTTACLDTDTGLKSSEAVTVSTHECSGSVAGRPTGLGFRFSALARFRPTFSASSVLTPTRHVPRLSRPNLP